MQEIWNSLLRYLVLNTYSLLSMLSGRVHILQYQNYKGIHTNIPIFLHQILSSLAIAAVIVVILMWWSAMHKNGSQALEIELYALYVHLCFAAADGVNNNFAYQCLTLFLVCSHHLSACW